MTIKISYERAEGIAEVQHIASFVTPTGKSGRHTTVTLHAEIARHGQLLEDHAKRQAIRNVIDEAIHRGFL